MMRKKEKDFSDIAVSSVIGEKSVLEGDFRAGESTRVDGEIRGNVTCEGKLLIGPKGKINGNVTSDGIMVSGEVIGDVTCKGRVEISSSGKIIGDIQASVLVIDENAIFNGNCNMSAAIKVAKKEE